MISALFNQILYYPLLNILVFLYNIIPGQSFGLAIILLTIIIKFILSPLNQKSLKAQKAMQKIQPELKKLQQQHKDPMERNKAIMAFYKENKVNPVSGCLPVLLQFPIIIALFQLLRKVLEPDGLNGLYSFVGNPGQIDPWFLGINLAVSSIVLAILAGGFQFIQAKMMMQYKKDPASASDKSKAVAGKFDISSMMGKQMTYVMPIFTVIIAARFPAGLALYWIISTVFSIGEQYWINYKNDNKN